jgi:hypothetical protein
MGDIMKGCNDRPELSAQEVLQMLKLKTFKSLQMKLKNGELTPYVSLDRDGNEWGEKIYGVRDDHPKWFYYRAHIEAYMRKHAIANDVDVPDDSAMKQEVLSLAESLRIGNDIPRMAVFQAMRDRHRGIGMRRMHNFVRAVLNSAYGLRPYKQARKGRKDEQPKEGSL